MDFIDEIKTLAARISNLTENIQTEEATKNALVMPFINILGYNVFDPNEVVPEYTTDHGIKKGEKVDYALFKDDKPVILIECKNIDADLDKEHASQLFRYFNVSEVKIGILTNGIVYRFYSDLESTNKMDEKPFLEIDLLNIKEPLIKELKRFRKESFDLDDLATVASELKYTREIKHILLNEMNSPSDDFVKFFAKRVYSGMVRQNLLEHFSGITKNAFNQFVNDRINERLTFAMTEDEPPTIDASNDENSTETDADIEITDEELEGYYIVKAILHEIIDINRVAIRGTKSYCGILLDDNNRNPICRLRFKTKNKYVGIFDDEIDNKKENKTPISELNEIYVLSDKLKHVVEWFDEAEKGNQKAEHEPIKKETIE